MARRKIFEAVINAAAELRKLGGTQAERMARAAEQGNKIPAYHGGDGGVLDFTPGSNRGSMGAAYFNDKIRNAYRYAYGGGIDEGRPLREYRDLQREQLPDRNPVVQKVLLRMQKPLSPSDVTSDMVINALGRDRVISLLDNDYSFAAHIDENFEGSKKAFLSDDSNLRDWLDRYDDEGAVILEHDNEAIGSDRSGPFVFAHINGLLKDVVSKNGFDGFKFYDNEMGGITYVPLEPNQIRSVNADFNPEYRDSPNLLAGIAGAMPYAGATAAALAGVTGSQEAEAGPLQSLGRAAPYLTSAALGGAAALQSGDAEAGPLDALGRAAPYLATGALGAAMMTPQDAQAEPISILPPTYNDTMQRTQFAVDKIDQFKAKRAGKRGAMDIMKLELQTLLKGANEVANDVIFPALDKPLQGYLGLSEVFGSLAQGRGFDTAMQRGAQVAQQPVDATTYNMGGTVTDTLSPYVPAPVAAGAGALTHAGALLASPF